MPEGHAPAFASRTRPGLTDRHGAEIANRCIQTNFGMPLPIVDLEPEQIRKIVQDLDPLLEPAGFVRLPGGKTDVYRIDLAA
jgi:hypothetical protein